MSFIRIALRVVFTTLVTSNLTLKLAAHDHFQPHMQTDQIKASCFADSAPNVAPMSDPRRGWKHSFASSYNLLRSEADQLKQAWLEFQPLEVAARIASQIPTGTFRDRPRLVVNRPAAGKAPSPQKATALQLNYLYATHVGNWDESYLPYDLAEVDRHFGTRIELLAIRDAAAEVADDAEFISEDLQLEELDLLALARSTAADLVKDSEVMQLKNKLVSYATAMIGSLRARGLNYIEGWAHDVYRKPYFNQPTFVILELDGGKQLLLRVEDAREWSFFQEKKTVASQNDLAEAALALADLQSLVPSYDFDHIVGSGIKRLQSGWQAASIRVQNWAEELKNMTLHLHVATQVRFHRGTQCLR